MKKLFKKTLALSLMLLMSVSMWGATLPVDASQTKITGNQLFVYFTGDGGFSYAASQMSQYSCTNVNRVADKAGSYLYIILNNADASQERAYELTWTDGASNMCAVITFAAGATTNPTITACSAGPDPGLDIPTDVESEYCYTVHTANQPATKWATDMENGNVVITMYDAPGATNARFRNGGFEGGMGGFKVLSGDGFATVEDASNYFTREETSTTVFTLKRKANVTLPNPCKIRFQTEAFSWACNESGGAYTKPCVFEYTYGGQCTATVDVTGVTLNKSVISIEKENTFDLVATVLPVYATNQDVTWETSAESIATVVDGVVTGVSAGEATITVRTDDGNFTATCTVTVTEKLSQCYGDLGHFGNPANVKMHYEIEYNEGIVTFTATGINNPLDFAELQIIGVGNFAMTNDGNGVYTWSRSGAALGDKWYFRFLYSDTSFGGNEMTAENFTASDANMRYYVVGECLPPYKAVNEDYTTLPGVEATASSTRDNTPGAALVDNNTAWGSIWDVDPQWFMVDLGKECVFNAVTVKWSTRYANNYDVLYSRDGENFKMYAEHQVGVANEEISAGGAPTIARYIKLQLKSRGAGYGYEIKKVAVKYVENSELTSLTASIAAKYLKAGQNYPIVLDARDQYGLSMAAGAVEYTVSPAAAGTVTDGKFYAAADFHGVVTIGAHVGEIVSENIVKTVVVGDNLALNNAMTGVGTYSEDLGPARAVDGNDGTEWQGRPVGAEGKNYEAWFVVDLQNTYDIDLITIHFEGACSNAYHIDFSSDNANWATGYSFVAPTPLDVNNHTDYVATFTNNVQVRYVKFVSTKAATGYGMKIFELQVYGKLNESASLHNVAAVASPAEGGVVAVKLSDAPVSKADEGSIVNFIATANPHFSFVNWSDGSTANPYPVTVGTEDITLTATFARTEYAVSVATADAAKGSAEASVANAVAINGTVTFTATAEEGYAFVNWTDENGLEVSTDEEFVVEHANRDYNLTANFDYRRDAYCRHAITSNNGRKFYLTMGETETAGVYQIRFEGSEEATITGINNANYAINWVRTEIESASAPKQEGQDVIFNKASGRWQLSTDGYGSAWINFSVAAGYTLKDVYVWAADIYFATNHGEQGFQLATIQALGELRYHIDWTASCSDEEAPVLAVPTATALNETDIRLTMSATDNWEGLITYVISREDAEDIVLTDKASGATVTYDVTGLATDATYTFSIVATDAAGNACAAKNCSATLSSAGDVNAPTDVTVSAKPMTDTSVELTLFANDDYDGDITYTITYAGGEQVTSATRGTETKYVVAGLTASTAYTFSVVAADAKPNAADAVEASATTFAPNLALNKPVEVAAYQNGKEGYKAVDGNDGTEWGTWGNNYATSNVLTVNLQGVYDIATIDIYTSGMEGQRHMTILGSLDGENFTTIVADKNYVENVHAVSTDVNAQVRYIRVVGPTNGMVAIRELAVYGTLAADEVAPVVTAPIVANGVSATSVQVQAQATDNFCGNLTYHFFLDGVEKQSVVKAYGEEAIAVIDELVMGNTYTFGVKAEDEAGNLSEMVTATAGPVADTEAPVITSVVTGEVTYESVELLITATDNTAGELTFVVSLNSEVVATEVGMHNVEKSIVISGLNYLTEYRFSVVAKDASDNTSLANTDAVVTTTAPYYPLEAAPVPTHAATDVMSVYSNHYETIIINENFNKKTWCNIDVEEKTIAEDKFMFYSVNSTNTRETAWGNSADNYEALLAESVYTDGENKGMDLTRVEYLHVDIWSLTAADNISIRLRDAELAKVNHDGTGWNSFDLPLSAHSAQDQLNNVRWMKFVHVGSATQDVRYFAIDNVYFYRTTPAATSVRTLASTETMGTICIPQGAIPVSGATFYELAYKEEQNGELYKIHFDQVDRLEPGHAYVFEPEVGATEITVVYTMENLAAVPVNVNGLIGTFTGINTDLSETGANILTDKYIVYENKIRRCGNGCGLRANRAYIDPAAVHGDVVAPAPGRRRISLGTQDSQITTDIENLDGAECNVQSAKLLINGQVFILRGERMYNAQGQLVK